MVISTLWLRRGPHLWIRQHEEVLGAQDEEPPARRVQPRVELHDRRRAREFADLKCGSELHVGIRLH